MSLEFLNLPEITITQPNQTQHQSGECKLQFNKHFHQPAQLSSASCLRSPLPDCPQITITSEIVHLQFCRHIFSLLSNFLDSFSACYFLHFSFLLLCQNMLLWIFWNAARVICGQFKRGRGGGRIYRHEMRFVLIAARAKTFSCAETFTIEFTSSQ